jgi:hypothetical protein
MERWAKWRYSCVGGYGKTFFERCLEGMPGTNCPTCGGSGKYLDLPACPTCGGSGRIKVNRGKTVGKINPAFIFATYVPLSDTMSERVDREVCRFRQEGLATFYFVLMEEYTQRGTQRMKAKRLLMKYNYYCKVLKDAHAKMRAALGI